MIKKGFKIISCLIMLAFITTILFGCGASNTETTKAATSAINASDSSGSDASGALEPITLTELYVTDSELDGVIAGDPNKTPYNKIREEKTGVHIEAIPVSADEGAADQKLNLLIASGQTPDIIPGNIRTAYPGGVTKAYEDNVVIKLNDYLDKYAPNFKKLLDNQPEFKKDATADDGSIYAFGKVSDKTERVFYGPIIREDLLKAANITKLPETIDEWYAALKAFKAAGIKYPFSSISYALNMGNAFVGAYGAGYDSIIGDDDTVKFGPMEAGFKEFLATWHKWFEEGLIDPDYFTIGEHPQVKTKLANGEAAASVGMLSYLAVNADGQAINPAFHLVATKLPVLNAGETPRYGMSDPAFVATDFVSSKCKYIERAIQYLDWAYSEEGIMVMNFGIEGESYTMVNGYPTYSELITQDPNSKGWSKSLSLKYYAPASQLVGTYQDIRYFEQIRLATEEQKQGQPLWTQFQRVADLSTLPLSYTSEESDAYAKLTEINTYKDEAIQRFIIKGDLSGFDAFVSDLKKMGIEKVLEVENAGYKRYISR